MQILNHIIIKNIKDIFVELTDEGFVIKDKISNSEIYVDIYLVIVELCNAFKYEVISEYVIMFIDYINTIWKDIEVWYDYKYISYDGVDDCFSKKVPPNDLDIVSMRVRVKKKGKENFIKRFLKKFEQTEYNMKHLKRFNESFDNLPDLTLEQKINTYISFKDMSIWQKNVSAQVIVDDKFFEGKDYDEYTFDDFFEMDKFIGYKKSLFGTQNLEPGNPKRTSKSFDWYQKSHQTAIVRVMKSSKFNESSDFEYDTWEEITSSLDVYQLYELLQFKYGEVLTDTKQAIDEEEGDYNPDHIYEVIDMK